MSATTGTISSNKLTVEGSVRKATFTHDTDTLYLLHDHSIISVVDISNNMTVVRILDSALMVNDFCPSPDGKWLLTGHNDRICLWDLINGRLVSTEGHRLAEPVRSLACNGRYVASVPIGSRFARLFLFEPMLAPLSTAPDSSLADNVHPEELLFSTSLNKFVTFVNWKEWREQSKPRVPVKRASSAPFFLTELASASSATTTTTTADTSTESSTNTKPVESPQEIHDLFLKGEPGQIHDEVALASPETRQTMSQVVLDMSKDPSLFDRALALTTIMLQDTHFANDDDNSSNDGLLEEAVNALAEKWSPCHDMLHAGLNAIRVLKNRNH
jgi:hypothetical protein